MEEAVAEGAAVQAAAGPEPAAGRLRTSGTHSAEATLRHRNLFQSQRMLIFRYSIRLRKDRRQLCEAAARIEVDVPC